MSIRREQLPFEARGREQSPGAQREVQDTPAMEKVHLFSPRRDHTPVERPDAPRVPFGNFIFLGGENPILRILSFIGHGIWKGPVVSFLAAAAYVVPIWMASAEFAVDTALSLTAFPLLPYVLVAGLLIGLWWAWSDSKDD